MSDEITITVDGRELQAPKGTLLYEVCRANGIDIPIFCYHTKLGPVGACRTCLVEQEGAPKPITACSTPIADGMKFRTRSPVAQKMQRGIFEFLLLNHPLDCPICDRGGECPLQDQVFAYGPGTSRYVEPKRHHVKPIPLGPTITLDRERCVLCWRCVRFCADIAEDKSIILLDRGDHSMVGTFQDEPYESNFSGNVIELCPVGALTSSQQRFSFRPWELQNRPSICPHCALGCNINVSVRKNDEVIRFLSRDNPDVDNSWLCDRGRFGTEFINASERLESPMIRRGEAFVQVSWFEALEFIAQKIHAIVEESGPQAVAGIASPRLTNEDLFVFRRFMRDVIGSAAIDHFPRSTMILGASQMASSRALDRRLMPISDLSTARTIVLLGADPSRRAPVLELRIREAVNKHEAKLAVINHHEIALTSKADYTLSYSTDTFSETIAALAATVSEVRSGRVAAADGASSPAARMLAQGALLDGPIAVLYDDAFEGIEDKGNALAAVADLVEVLTLGGEVGVIPMLDDCNSMGARDLEILPGGGLWSESVVARLLQTGDGTRAAIILGSNVVRDAGRPELVQRLQSMDLVVVHELALTETARCADVVLPASSFAEKDGTFTNTERRVQRLTPCVPSPGIARPDWESLVDLSQYFDTALSYTSTEEIWDAIERSVPSYSGLSYFDIGPRGTRPAVLQPVSGGTK